MAWLAWSRCPVVESIPATVSGAWVFRGTRTPVAVVFENMEDGMTIDEVIEQFPVSRSHVKAVLESAARSLDAPVSARSGCPEPVEGHDSSAGPPSWKTRGPIASTMRS